MIAYAGTRVLALYTFYRFDIASWDFQGVDILYCTRTWPLCCTSHSNYNLHGRWKWMAMDDKKTLISTKNT